MTHQTILTPLHKAVSALLEALATPTAGLDELAISMRRDAIIQRFEFTYELCWKTMRRILETTAARSKTDELLSMKDLYRLAFEAGIIANPQSWFEYNEARNITSHVYDEKKAKLVLAAVVKFAPDAAELLAKLEADYVA